jgi:uncharacterized membrane protein YedE/YeeE
VSQALITLCLGFGLGAILCMTQYILIRLGRFHRNPYLGLTVYSSESNETWNRAHLAAAPWIFRAGVVAFVASLIAGLGLLFDAGAETADVLQLSSGVVGAVAVALYLGANGAAHRATRRK